MRRANNIETINQLSSRRGHEERSVTTEQQPICHLEGGITCPEFSGTERSVATEPQMNCHLEGGTTERSVTTELSSNRFPAYRFTSRMGWQAGSSLFGMTDRFANCRFKLPGGANNLPIDAFKLPIVGLNCQLTHLNCQLSAQTARGRVNTTWGPVDMGVLEKLTDAGGSALPPVSASLRTTELAASTVPLLVGGRVEPVASKKTWRKSGGTENGLRMAESCSAERSVKAGEINCGVLHHLTAVNAVPSSWKEEKFKPVVTNFLSSRRGNEERSVITEHQTSCHLEGAPKLRGTERSVSIVQQYNRFPAYRFTSRMGWQAGSSLFGMTDKLATCNLHLATELLTIKYNNPSLKLRGYRVVNSNIILDPSPCRELPLQGKPVLNRAGAHPTGSSVGSKLFPLSKGKWLQPKGSGVELIEKNAHLSTLKTMGTGDNKLFPFFLISNLATARFYRVGNRINKPHDAIVRQQRDSHWNANILPLLRGGARRAEGYIVANINKTSAYET